jgi:hypothetical protein
MLALTFAEWELIQTLVERRELQLRDIIESDGMKGVLTGKKVLKEYKKICDILATLSDQTRRGRSPASSGKRVKRPAEAAAPLWTEVEATTSRRPARSAAPHPRAVPA